MTVAVKVDVWSDIACPFCYIGKRKFEAAVATSDITVDVEYHSFELAPGTPDEGSASHAETIANKLGVSLSEARKMEQQVTFAATEVGITIDYARMQSTNTHKAHQLLHYAKAHGRQSEMKERLMAAHFTGGVHVGRVAELADLAAQVGLDHDDVVRTLDSGEFVPAVEADIEQARSFGIRGVPFFVLDGRFAVSGAQDPTTFERALQKAFDDKETG